VKRLLLLLFICVFIWPVNKTLAQDPHLTQFFSAPLYLAPSFAGATQQHRIASTWRNQWSSIPGGFVTYALAYDHYFSSFNSGLGVLFLRDYAGSGKLGNFTASLLYSYDFQIFDVWHVRPGINFDYLSYSIDFTALKFRDQMMMEGEDLTASPNVTAPSDDRRGGIDGGASVLFYSDKIWFGSSVSHLFRPDQSLYYDKGVRLPIKYTIFGGTQLARKSRLLKPADEVFSLAFMYYQQADYRQLDLGVYWYKVPLVMGVWYRGIPVVNAPRGDALACLIGFKLKHFSFGYSYDFTVSNLINSSGGAHEVSVIYEFTTSRKKKKHAIPCPEF
jgi:type IX secretion system PorP/SprF family membrane protein